MNQSKLINYAMLVGLSMVWGSSFILIKKALLGFTPVQVGALRVVIAGSVLLLIGFKHLKQLKKKHLLPILSVGLVGSGIPSILFSLAQTQVASSASGALNSLTPLFTLIIGYFIFQIPISRNKVGGILVGLLGAVFLFYQNNAFDTANANYYLLLIVMATVCYAFSTNIVKKYLQEVPATTITLAAFLLIFPIFIPLLLATDIITTLQTATPTTYWALASVTTLAILGTALANIVFFRLTQRTSTLFAASVTYLIPIVATFWGILDGEQTGLLHFVGLGLIVLGVYLVGKSKPKN